ncbi:hypothetical protein T190423A01A_60229 [Tenacibaculum sp. 190130A14a]|uniref:Uncharacterized protein n=1 Tax=Tenacibaculum polynesiense TaxID=3137857 RepID=A0ABP1F7D1_9FLAO
MFFDVINSGKANNNVNLEIKIKQNATPLKNNRL